MNEISDHERLCRIGCTPTEALMLAQAAERWLHDSAAYAAVAAMRVTEVQRGGVTLHDGDVDHRARLLPALRVALADGGDAIAVGDWVVAGRNACGEWWAVERVPPRNQLARRLHDGRDKVARTVIVSNVDTAFVAMGLDGDYNLRRLDRYVALLQTAGVAIVVVLTKADGCADAERRRCEVQQRLPQGGVAVAVDARGDAARAALAPWLQPGQTVVLIGSSGTGKSTLTNGLADAAQATGGNRAGDGRGRHTTTSRTLHRTAAGACIVDTPGLRTLRIDADADRIGDAFDDIARLAASCRFADCRHDAEPGCAVRDGVDADRLRSFHTLQREAQRDAMTALDRRALVARWKARSRASRARNAEKGR